MGTRKDIPPEMDRELEDPIAPDRWRAMLAALSLYAPAARVRAAAAASLREVASRTPSAVAPYADDLAEALYVVERRTRWDALSALACIAEPEPDAVIGVAEIVSEALYQEASPAMRRLALHVLTTAALASEEGRPVVWQLLDEALLLLRGEAEYPALLASVLSTLPDEIGDVEHLRDIAMQGASDRRARVRVLAHDLRRRLSTL
jgi:hypothetical protein